MKNRGLLITGLLFFLFLTVITSCTTKEDTIAIISVRDASNSPVANAEVRIYGSGSLGVVTVNDVVHTNSAGEAIFNYNDEYQLGQAGVAILDISVTKDSYTGQGIIKIVEETTTKETIYIGL